MNVREIIPKRRLIPSKNPIGEKWSEHKPDLREDFNKHCAYCDSYDGFSHTYFEVDHFVPKKMFKLDESFELCQYNNLVYSCKFCNNKKSSKWPSGDTSIHNLENKGFVDPTLEEYDDHLYRTNVGGIKWRTDLGEWMVKEGFKFDERDYEVKLLWELNSLRKFIYRLVELAKDESLTLEVRNSVNDVAKDKALTYFLSHTKLMEYYKAF